MKYLIPYSFITILYLIAALCCLQTTFISWLLQNITNIEIIVVISFIFFIFGSTSLIVYNFVKSDTNIKENRLIKLTLITYTTMITFAAIYSIYETAIK